MSLSGCYIVGCFCFAAVTAQLGVGSPSSASCSGTPVAVPFSTQAFTTLNIAVPRGSLVVQAVKKTPLSPLPLD
jgi:hypothetical protein